MMPKTKISYCFLWIAILSFASCSTYKLSSIQVEMMKPALLTLSQDIDTIAIFKRDLYQSDTVTFRYFKNLYTDSIIDPEIQYRDLSNQCVDALAEYLEGEGYFLKVINYRDSLNSYLATNYSLIDYPELLRKWKVDACIFLDNFHFDDYLKSHHPSLEVHNSEGSFPEFKGSTQLEQINAHLFWTISIKGDTAIYKYKQPDDVYYGNSFNPDFFGSDLNHKRLLENTSIYLAKSFGPKLIPSIVKDFRFYYQSHNGNMLIAEKYLLEGEWLKAAEIYNKQTNNKNQNIAAKATYNMALICEMEGNMDAANDWVNRSLSAYKIENKDHLFNCTQYTTILTKRKKEIELLGKQVRIK
ncbi:MAG TPA: hypothetical protein DCL77_03045 [Prolixibacteraceae bacterium]|jgi:hypothetical protein|nr:hypothetical protein [Prolixibacteraceae bacterium]